jgi:hypothetical protein
MDKMGLGVRSVRDRCRCRWRFVGSACVPAVVRIIERHNMKNLTILLALVAACAGDIEPTQAPAPLTVAEPDVDEVFDVEPEVVDAAVALAEIQPPDVVEPSAGVDLHDLWFGDSGWDCCTRPLCAWLCDEGETPTVDPAGSRICCSPDIGQCDERDGGT